MENKEVFKILLTQFCGHKLESQNFGPVAEEFKHLPFQFVDFMERFESVDNLFKVIQDTVESLGIKHIIIDNLQCLLYQTENAGERGKLSRQDAVFGRLRRMANKKKIHVTVVIHPVKVSSSKPLDNYSISGSAKAVQESNNILIIQRVKGEQYLEITKNHFNGRGCCSLKMTFNSSNLTFCLSNPTFEE